MANHTYPNPDDLLRRATLPRPSQTDVVARAVRTDVPLPDDISEVELIQYRLERELRDARDRIRALEGTLRRVAGLVKPYLGGNGR
jgi:hypothetical protein